MGTRRGLLAAGTKSQHLKGMQTLLAGRQAQGARLNLRVSKGIPRTVWERRGVEEVTSGRSLPLGVVTHTQAGSYTFTCAHIQSYRVPRDAGSAGSGVA
jgi:hypothetical protein